MIVIKDIKFKHIMLEMQADGNWKITGKYDLMGDKGKVVASQGFNGYDDLKVSLNRDAKDSLEDFTDELKNIIEYQTGIAEAVKELKEG